tara:strand:+ start:2581 stop:3750 length:1170 start_codon:yes stop_codon:yes gene_type:complete
MKCDICNLKYSLVFDFGKQFLANHYIKHIKYNAKVAYCNKCIILKCVHKIPNNKVFQTNYPYFSSLSSEFKIYLKKISKELKNKLRKGKILEIGSNDGSFLENFKTKNYQTIGIEPAYSSHKIAVKKKINSINKYFNDKSFKYLYKKYNSFDLIFSINTFAHIDEINKNFKLVRLLLNNRNKKSLFVFENIDILSLIKKNDFSQLYDEHVYTLSANSIDNICNKFKLVLYDVKKTKNQNGCLRYYIGHKNLKQKNSVKKIIQEEKKFINISLMKNFYKNILGIKKRSKIFFNDRNKKILALGASAKATFIVNFLSLDNKCIKFIFDNSSYKINRYLPGTKIKIKNELLIKNIKNCYLFVFIPNHINEIIKKYGNLFKKRKIIIKSINDF